jgi:hypothetical protein
MYTISVDDLVKQLKIDRVRFSFLKKDNTMRNVFGTLRPEFIPNGKDIKESEGKIYKNVRFYDLEKNGWRSLPSNTRVVNLTYETEFDSPTFLTHKFKFNTMKDPETYYVESDIFGLSIDQRERLIKLIKHVQEDAIKATVKFTESFILRLDNPSELNKLKNIRNEIDGNHNL